MKHASKNVLKAFGLLALAFALTFMSVSRNSATLGATKALAGGGGGGSDGPTNPSINLFTGFGF